MPGPGGRRAEPGVVRPHPRLFLPEHLRADVEALQRAWPAGLPESVSRSSALSWGPIGKVRLSPVLLCAATMWIFPCS